MLPLAFGIHNEQYGCDGYNMRVINPSSILGLDTMLTTVLSEWFYTAGFVVQFYSDEL